MNTKRTKCQTAIIPAYPIRPVKKSPTNGLFRKSPETPSYFVGGNETHFTLDVNTVEALARAFWAWTHLNDNQRLMAELDCLKVNVNC